jgi:competence protein ComEC
LRAVGVGRIDEVLVTHEDKDHSGGAESVLESLPVGLLRSSLPFENILSAQPVRQAPCLDGQSWEWDGVRFDVLHPTEGEYRSSRKTNALSCVLKVSTAHGRVLLTSDIEAPVEAALLTRHGGDNRAELGADLQADVLLAPHHGSRTSSTPEFIAAVGARTVIFPVGYRNRFGHPKPEVEERYRQSGAVLRRTDLEGALSLDLRAGAIVLEAERETRRRYWHGR